ncbi:hypothetical protein Glove_110g68 [Diversispora epigaea]|uniref:Obg family GTPase CgtA n=1 Tax=Diversispora epigaea TaxID=1348612 RepID=A0A397J1T3_9GLOM|nr:hypothetical protein Glove_110g68 [Diversispora epigaea]
MLRFQKNFNLINFFLVSRISSYNCCTSYTSFVSFNYVRNFSYKKYEKNPKGIKSIDEYNNNAYNSDEYNNDTYYNNDYDMNSKKIYEKNYNNNNNDEEEKNYNHRDDDLKGVYDLRDDNRNNYRNGKKNNDDEIKRNILNDNIDKPILKVSAYDIGIPPEEDVKTEVDKEIIAGKYTVQSYKLRDKARPFIDFMHMTITGGHGGDGCVAFLREKGRSQEPPSGGNGGRGGNVIFIASPSHSSLHSISRSITAGSGENGRGNMRHGAAGKDIILSIPLGTVIREIDYIPKKNSKKLPPKKNIDKIIQDNNFEDEEKKMVELYEEEEFDEEIIEAKRKASTWIHYPRYENKNILLKDFKEADNDLRRKQELIKFNMYKRTKINLDLSMSYTQYIVAHGGEGGKGNPHFATNVNRSPTYASQGQPGEIRYLELEVKTIADVGLVGLPNAGKSTFLTAVSNAHPKIAPYPFTTLNPYIGTVDYFDRYQITIADIPGLIKGAHKNIGLGHSFLRHVERSKVLVYVIDLVTNEPWEDWKTLINELEQYNEGLTRRPSLIVANKADVTEKAKKNLKLLETEVAYIRGEQEKDWIAKESIKIFKNYNLEDSNFKGFNPDYNSRGSDPNYYKDNEDEEENEDEFHIIPISAKYQKNIVKVTTILRQMVERIKMKEQKEQKEQKENEKTFVNNYS